MTPLGSESNGTFLLQTQQNVASRRKFSHRDLLILLDSDPNDELFRAQRDHRAHTERATCWNNGGDGTREHE